MSSQEPQPLGPSFLKGLTSKIVAAYRSALPEREALVARLEQQLNEIIVDDGSGGFSAFPPYSVIKTSWWALEGLWCFAYATAVFAPRIERAITTGNTEILVSTTDETFVARSVLGWAFGVLRDSGRHVWLHENVPWPYDSEGKLIFDDESLAVAERIFLGAVGWILLHELAHIDRKHGKTEDPIKQEKEADADATKWLLEQAPFGDAHDRANGMAWRCYLFGSENICLKHLILIIRRRLSALEIVCRIK